MYRLEHKLEWLMSGLRRKRNFKRIASRMLRASWKEYIKHKLSEYD